MLSISLFGMLLLYKEEASLIKEKFKGLEFLLELSISVIEVEVGFLHSESGSRMVKFLLLLSVSA